MLQINLFGSIFRVNCEVRLHLCVVRQQRAKMESAEVDSSVEVKDSKAKTKSAKKRKGSQSYYKSKKSAAKRRQSAKKKVEEPPKPAEDDAVELPELPDVLAGAGDTKMAEPVGEVAAQDISGDAHNSAGDSEGNGAEGAPSGFGVPTDGGSAEETLSNVGPTSCEKSDIACEPAVGASDGSGAEGAPSGVGIPADEGTAEKTPSSVAPISSDVACESAVGASDGSGAEGAPSGVGIPADGGTAKKTLPGIGPNVSEDFTDCTGCTGGSASDVAQE